MIMLGRYLLQGLRQVCSGGVVQNSLGLTNYSSRQQVLTRTPVTW